MLDKLSLADLERLQVQTAPDPMDHPKAQRQVELEELMLSKGRDNFTVAVERAKKRGNVSHLEPYRRMTEQLVEPIADGLRAWVVAEGNAKRGRAVAYKPLKMVDPAVAALVAVRSLLDTYPTGDGSSRPRLLNLAMRIGALIEAEARMEQWSKMKPKLWQLIQRQLSEDKATVVHRRRVNVNRFNNLVREEIGWRDWSSDERKFVGLTVVKVMVECSEGNISLVADPTHTNKSKNDRAPFVIEIHPDTMTALLHALTSAQGSNPVYMPCVIPPAPWSNMWDGGYPMGILPRRSLIRFKADNVEQAKVALKELGNVDMPGVYDSVNVMQETPWAINRRVYDVARAIWDNDLAIAGFPSKKAETVPPRPTHALKGSLMEKEWKRAASTIIGRNSLLAGRVLKASRTLEIAEHFVEEPEFFFPHQLDFRGRAYPIPVDLQPQGEDLARGLLTAAAQCAKPLGERGAWWLAVHVANCWGKDKLQFADRVKWVHKNEALFRKIAEAPLTHRQWAKPKSQGGTSDHWQALAATFEWVRYLNEGEGMLCGLPIRIDGSCNGIQHLSAMGRDEIGGASVNLIPDTKPHDIYMEVAQMLEARLADLMETGDATQRGYALRWLDILGGKVPREITKRPVMILPYGGTQRAYQKYTVDWTREFDPTGAVFPGLLDRATREQRVEYVGMVNFLVDVLWEQVEAKLPASRRIQKWLQQCARLAAARGVPLRWTTPMGFVVRHFYGKSASRTIETKIDGQRIQIRDYTISKDMDLNDQMKGIPPNFVHSLDACVLQMAVNMSFNEGLDFITTIHDAFGAVPADMDILASCVRKCFVRTHEIDVLREYRQACMEVLGDDVDLIMAMPQTPKRGTLDLKLVLDSPYFFQ